MAAGAFAWRVRRNEAEFRPVTLSELFVEDAWFVGGTRPAGTRECPLCYRIPVEPLMFLHAACAPYTFCGECAQRLRKPEAILSLTPFECPFTRTRLAQDQLAPDLRAASVLADAPVRCPGDGCAWTGTVAQLRAHLTSACAATLVHCFHCASGVRRSDASTHSRRCNGREDGAPRCATLGCAAFALPASAAAALRARGAGASAASGGSGSRASVLSAPDGKESDDAASVGVDGKVGTVRGRLRSSGRTSEAASPAKRPAVDPAAAAAAAATVVSASATPSGYNAAAAAASDTDGVPVQTWDAHCSRCRDPLSAPPIPVRMAADEAAEQAYVAKFRVTADQLQMVVAAIQRRPGISPKEIFHTLRLMLPATKGITAEQYPALFAAFMSGVAKPQRWKLTHALCACVINPWRLHVLTGAECYFDGRYGRLHVFGGSPFHSGLKLDAPVIGLVYAID